MQYLFQMKIQMDLSKKKKLNNQLNYICKFILTTCFFFIDNINNLKIQCVFNTNLTIDTFPSNLNYKHENIIKKDLL